MISLLRNPVVVQRFACRVLLLLIVFQLGACPCGCVEHNAWIQMLGLCSHDHHDVAESGHAPALHGSDHDCTGEPRAAYLDNAKPVQIDEKVEELLEVLTTQNSTESLAIHGLDAPQSEASRIVIPRASQLSTLQVYQL